jgi:transcription initiation factor TFIIH subunit 2
VIKEDADGRMEINVEEVIEREKRRGAERGRGARLGMMRQLYVILDASEAMLDPDLKPTRQICLLKVILSWVLHHYHHSTIITSVFSILSQL